MSKYTNYILKPSIPKGTRDFSPQEMVKRNYIFDTIKQVFQRYGFLPIETPAMENLSTLMGKYGEEGDKLIFKILNSGDFLDGDYLRDIGINVEKFTSFYEEWKTNKTGQVSLSKLLSSKSLLPYISEKALRYDLTVPFARYVVQHQHEITFPFKRYQIQPVWRADRPQKGRYREFYQCDADVIGSTSLINEVELVQMIDEVFTQLKVPVVIKINNRKILSGIAELIGAPDKMIDIAIAIDKIDKIGENGVIEELKAKEFSEEQINKLHGIFMMHAGRVSYGDGIPGEDINQKNLYFLKTLPDFLKKMNVITEDFISNTLIKGIEELDFIFKSVSNCKLQTAICELDITLARGLNYYTGAIFEVKANAGTFTSSISGGGRYDDLTGVFGLPNMSGVGISFGADRIYDVLNELNLFPESVSASTKILFVTFGEAEQNYCLPLLTKVRKAGINAEVYPDAGAKMKKQMGYADDKKIPFVILVGGDEMQSGLLSLKDMTTGVQEKLTIDEIIEKVK